MPGRRNRQPWQGSTPQEASIEPPAILEVTILKGMFGVGLAEVSWPRGSIGYGSLAFERKRAVVANWYFYRTAVDAVNRAHQLSVPPSEAVSGAPCRALKKPPHRMTRWVRAFQNSLVP